MKKLCFGVLLGLALLFPQIASASACGLCQSYYPCDWACEHCVRSFEGPGLWIEDGYCWGTIVPGVCGNIIGSCPQYGVPDGEFLMSSGGNSAQGACSSALMPTAPTH